MVHTKMYRMWKCNIIQRKKMIEQEVIPVCTYIADMISEKQVHLYKKEIRLLDDYWEFYQIIGLIDAHNPKITPQEWLQRDNIIKTINKKLLETVNTTNKNIKGVTGHETITEKRELWQEKVMNIWNAKTIKYKNIMNILMSRDESRIITPFVETTKSLKISYREEIPKHKGIIGVYDNIMTR